VAVVVVDIHKVRVAQAVAESAAQEQMVATLLRQALKTRAVEAEQAKALSQTLADQQAVQVLLLSSILTI
jgi:hypothetical protein